MGNGGSVLHENRIICLGVERSSSEERHGGEKKKRPLNNEKKADVEDGPGDAGDEGEDDGQWPTRKFCDNRVISSKYTLWSFIPRNLFEQFRRIANFYFLCITIIQLTTDSPVSATTSILPLAFVIMVTAVKQGYEDWLRHRADAKVNKAPASIIDPNGKRMTVECSHLMVGDIIRVEDGEDLPCDMILLVSSRRDGRAHVTTANLDGETNLKTLQCPRPLRFLGGPGVESQLAKSQIKIVCEEPTPDLYNFSGTIELLNGHKLMKNNNEKDNSDNQADGRAAFRTSLRTKFKCEPKVSLSIDNLLLRGARLKNTEFIYGCSVYTGQETKLSLNSKLTRNKFSSIERAINGFLFFFLVIMIIEIVVSLALKLTQDKSFASINISLREPKRLATTSTVVQDVFSFIILYNYLIPISLYVTIELQKFLGTFFFIWDADMFCEKTQQAAVCNTSDLNEELGQIQYLFTDKTGTLTENLMEFQRCSINKETYVETKGHLIKLKADGREENGIEIPFMSAEIEEFFVALALCHTAQVEKVKSSDSLRNTVSSNSIEDEENEDIAARDPTCLVYQASSPDEKALLEAARRCGVTYLGEKDDVLYVKVKDRVRMFMRLEVLEFSSERSRMSIAVEEVVCINGQLESCDSTVLLYCKGAETVLEKLSINGPKEETIKHIDDFAQRGLRTLMVGRRVLTKKDFNKLSAAIQSDRIRQAVATSKRRSLIGSIRAIPPQPRHSILTHRPGHSRNHSAGGVLDMAKAFDLSRTEEEEAVPKSHSNEVINPSYIGMNGITSHFSPRMDTNSSKTDPPSSNNYELDKNIVSATDPLVQEDSASKRCSHSDVNSQFGYASTEIAQSVSEDDINSFKDFKEKIICSCQNNFDSVDTSFQERKASLDSATITSTNVNKRAVMQHSRSKSSSDYAYIYGPRHNTEMGPRSNLGRERAGSVSMLKRLLSRQGSMLNAKESSESVRSFTLSRRDSGLKNSDAILAFESGLTILGATAVRDQLQEYVPETLESLRAAGMKIWILTGDKVETAVNVSFSCGHFKSGTKQLFLTGHTKYDTCCQALNTLSEKIKSDKDKQYGLVVDGMSLHQILCETDQADHKNVVNQFLTISTSCTAVVCCRMSPLQKCNVVQLIKHLSTKPITAAIGDGANDVSMIQEAHIGIGLMGKEGRQAARSSDFALARFHFLRKALLVHGHWYYVRLATLIQYFFYKNIVFNTPQVCFGAYSLFSTQSLYDGLYLTAYNLLMTSLPITLFGLFEQNIDAQTLMKYPHLYLNNRGNSLMSWPNFFKWTSLGIWHALALYFAVWGVWQADSSILTDGGPADLGCFGTTIFHIVVIVVNLKIWLESKFWTRIFILSILISIFGNMLLTYFYSIVSVEFQMYGVYSELLQSPTFWLLSTVVVAICLIPDVVIAVLRKPMKILRRLNKRKMVVTPYNGSYSWKRNSTGITISTSRLVRQDAFT
ncbi:phospholipid-transporting ATPase IF-like isoform X2 [Ischnura elegans]|uniref:phospholipid-transporting ATPase IF-like isoform X1 n=1 Tax=Ischnura elegans TaxID=197161 RepID=UPI001ED87BBD|nr:phospholipid-transporting ATPase IF-like isoform X1 [Ischnura elegans]XP_046393224.1 phospholipid-transporting ATPase IF-like isoform X2 [Ischnura elegans]